MRTGWRKVFRDLKQNKTRSILAVLAIAIGISGFGSVLSTYSILTRELNAGYLATNPASATIWTNRIDGALLNEIKRFPGIAQVEERRSVTARIRVGANEWRNAILFIIKDYSRIEVSTLKPQKGKWPPASGEILMERDALGVARAKIGDLAVIKMNDGSEHPLRLTGSVHDVGQAQARMEQLVYGYITLDTLKQIGQEPYLDQLMVVVSGNKFDEEHVHSTISKLKNFMEKSGHSVRRLEIPKPGAHPHADLMGTLLLFKSSFGLFALLLSGVLVMNLISALMAGQIRQIGIMKAIGARRSQIIRLYLASVFILSLTALVISIPISLIAGRSLATFMSRFLNFDLLSYDVASWVFGLQFLVGLIVPLSASLYPVMKGSRVTVREAISDYGIQQDRFADVASDRLIASVGGMTRLLLLSMRNTFRRRGRLAWIVSTLAAGGAIFIAAWNVRASLIHTVDVMLNSFQYDMSLSFAELYSTDDLERVIRSTPGVKHVESWRVAEAMPVTGGSHRNPINIVAAPHNTKTIILNIVEGRGLRRGDRNVLVINNALSTHGYDYRVGSKIRLRIEGEEQIWDVVGIARQPLAGAAAYADYDNLTAITRQNGRSKNVRVVTGKHDEASIQEIKTLLEQNLAKAGLRATSNVSMAERRRVIDEHNSVIYTFLIVMSMLIVVVGALGLMTVMSINVLERKREIGVLRAIGATRKKILLIVLAEGGLIGLLSWILAVVLSLLISHEIGNLAAGRILRTNLEFYPDRLGILIWFLTVLFFGAAASFLPAWHASRATVRELVGYE